MDNYQDQPRRGHYNRDDYNRDDSRGHYQPHRDYNRDDRGGGYQPRRDYNRDDRGGYQPRHEDDRGYQPRRDYNRDDRGGGYQPRRDYNRDDRGGGYQPRRDYNRDDRGGGYQPRRDYNRDDRGGGYQPRRDYNRDDRGGGYQPRRYDNRDQRGGGGYRRGPQDGRPPFRREGGFQDRPRRMAPAISIEDSPFLLPEHPLTQDFQRAIGMCKGVIVDVDPRKKRGLIEIDGFQYKFEDERKRDLQRKYPIQKFKDREIQFAFWPTYSQKAAQYRKIDEAPTIKIANLRRTLPQPGMVEIIGQVLMVEENLFVMSVFSASQRKKYMVTILQKYPGSIGEFIQMFGVLKDGGIHYQSHRVIPTGAEAEALNAEREAAKAQAAASAAAGAEEAAGA